jgi:hypothetical protein
MVLKVVDQIESDMSGMRKYLKLERSKVLEEDILGTTFHMSQCPAVPTPGEAFWIGDQDECLSYLAISPTTLGAKTLLEGKKAWTDRAYRRKGFHTQLLRAAASKGGLLADRDGMTASAYKIWWSSGLVRHWWDSVESLFVSEAQVPEQERFTTDGKLGNRYCLVLSTEEYLTGNRAVSFGHSE